MVNKGVRDRGWTLRWRKWLHISIGFDMFNHWNVDMGHFFFFLFSFFFFLWAAMVYWDCRGGATLRGSGVPFDSGLSLTFSLPISLSVGQDIGNFRSKCGDLWGRLSGLWFFFLVDRAPRKPFDTFQDMATHTYLNNTPLGSPSLGPSVRVHAICLQCSPFSCAMPEANARN